MIKLMITTLIIAIVLIVMMIMITIPLRTEFPVFWEFLGNPRNSQKFPIMQISSDLKSLELLEISRKGKFQFCENLDFLGIPKNSQLYKPPLI